MRCPQLLCLSVDDADLRNVPYDSLPPSLTRLELRRCLIPGSWLCCWAVPRLQHLVVHSINTFESHHLLNVASHYSLKTLSVSGFLKIHDADIEQAAPDLEELERFVLRGSFISDWAVEFIGRHMIRLRFLEIRSAGSLTSAGLERLTSLRDLETLGLDLSDRVSPGAVIALCQALPRLRNLRLTIPHCADEVRARIQESLPNVALHLIPYREHTSIYFTE
ncbi:F-box/LRR-repeat protein 12 [Patagioenas fasciata]|uniref:F-box/LRR-repeat protein 12 n=1 Tax=Patagioenas fasciata TaxID=372321 RepID=UPI003A9A185C